MLPTFIALARFTLVSSVCLSNALGESYPLGFLVGSWSSARLSSALIQILTEAWLQMAGFKHLSTKEEVLGYNTRSWAAFKIVGVPSMQGVDPTEVSSSVEGMYALLGCATWQNVEDRGCSTRNLVSFCQHKRPCRALTTESIRII